MIPSKNINQIRQMDINIITNLATIHLNNNLIKLPHPHVSLVKTTTTQLLPKRL